MEAPDRCRRLANAIQQLDMTEMEEMFKILHKSGCPYTRNNNGIFVNLSRCSEAILDQLEKYIAFCNQSRSNVKRYESLCEVLRAGPADNGQSSVAANTPKKTARDTHAHVLAPPSASGPPAVPVPALLRTSSVSSSMKFYLLTKKYSKQVVPNYHFIDDLVPEEPVMHQQQAAI